MSIFLKVFMIFALPILANAQSYRDQEFLANALSGFKDGYQYEFAGVLSGTQIPCNLKFEKTWSQGRIRLHTLMEWAIKRGNINSWAVVQFFGTILISEYGSGYALTDLNLQNRVLNYGIVFKDNDRYASIKKSTIQMVLSNRLMDSMKITREEKTLFGWKKIDSQVCTFSSMRM